MGKLDLHGPVVLAPPRGGVAVATEVAKALKAPLDLIVMRSVGAPGNPAVASIVDDEPPDVVLNREIVEAYALDDAALRSLIANERPELERRRLAYRGNRPPLSIAGKTAIIIDDGIATGTTMKVMIRALRQRSPRRSSWRFPSRHRTLWPMSPRKPTGSFASANRPVSSPSATAAEIFPSGPTGK